MSLSRIISFTEEFGLEHQLSGSKTLIIQEHIAAIRQLVHLIHIRRVLGHGSLLLEILSHITKFLFNIGDRILLMSFHHTSV